MSATITLTRPHAGQALVTLGGQVDLAALGRLYAATAGAAGCSQVVIDAAGVDFIDCAGLRPLVVCARAVAAGGGELCLRDPSPAVAQLITWCHLEGELATCAHRRGGDGQTPWAAIGRAGAVER